MLCSLALQPGAALQADNNGSCVAENASVVAKAVALTQTATLWLNTSLLRPELRAGAQCPSLTLTRT